jgi:hypothetical protein
MLKRTVLIAFFVAVVTALACAQMKMKGEENRPSPAAHAQCRFADGKNIAVDYSSPRAKGRKIFGGLVPYGEVWRTGANEATTFVTTTELNIGGKDVPVGDYTIFTVPSQSKWTLIINKKTGEWGIPYSYESDELGRADMKVSPTPAAVENFTISFDANGSSCMMNLSWENTQASIEIREKK